MCEEWVKVVPEGEKTELFDPLVTPMIDIEGLAIWSTFGHFCVYLPVLLCAWTRILQQMENNFQVQLDSLNQSFFSERDTMTQQHSDLKKVCPHFAKYSN